MGYVVVLTAEIVSVLWIVIPLCHRSSAVNGVNLTGWMGY